MISRRLWVWVLTGMLLGPCEILAAKKQSSADDYCPVETRYLDAVKELQGALVSSVQPDYSCFVDSTEVSLKDFLVVDVRHSDDFNAFSLNGSINLSPRLLLNSPQFKAHQLLLVDHGLKREETARLCSELKAKGFAKTYALKGGLESWADNPKKAFNQPLIQNQLNEVSSTELIRFSFANELLVLTDVEDVTILQMALSKHTKIEKLSFSDSVSISRAVSKSGQSVVLVSEKYTDLRQTLDLPGTYFLNDDLYNLVHEAEQLEVIKEKHGSIPDRYRCKV